MGQRPKRTSGPLWPPQGHTPLSGLALDLARRLPHIGVTGTSQGTTPAQRRTLATFLREGTLHHGDCINADSDAHDLAVLADMDIVIHPPSNPSTRAFKSTGNIVAILPEMPYLDRNKAIVDSTVRLIAVPDGPEHIRSGTWSTVRYARKRGKPVTIVWPDGSSTNGVPTT
jgi:hypothetical protein